jgi:hypothetical protein
MGNDEQYFHANVVDNHCGLSDYTDDCIIVKTHAVLSRPRFAAPVRVKSTFTIGHLG